MIIICSDIFLLSLTISKRRWAEKLLQKEYVIHFITPVEYIFYTVTISHLTSDVQLTHLLSFVVTYIFFRGSILWLFYHISGGEKQKVRWLSLDLHIREREESLALSRHVKLTIVMLLLFNPSNFWFGEQMLHEKV